MTHSNDTSTHSNDDALRRIARAKRAQDPRPNVLFVFTDQHTSNALSCAGNPWVNTPNIDAIARRGVRFENSYCPSPICGPSRASLLTSRMQHETKVHYNGEAPDPAIPNMGEIFRNAGYDTTWVGKWHLPESFPTEKDALRGFDHRPLPKEIRWPAIMRGDQTDMHFASEAYHYLRWEADKSPKPWLLSVSLHNPHDICLFCTEKPLEHANGDTFPPLPDNFNIPEDEPEAVQQCREHGLSGRELKSSQSWDHGQWRAYLQNYYQMTQTVDRAIGLLMEGLKMGGWLENTLIVFTSDHGEGLASQQWVCKNMLYNPIMNVPFILAYPQKIPEGEVNKTHIVSGLDILPTICDYAGISPTPTFRGESVRPYLEKNHQRERPFVVSELTLYPVGKKIIDGFAYDPADHAIQGRMVRSKRFKYHVFNQGNNPEQLFDLKNDPDETNNLAGDPAHAKALQAHRDYLASWLKQTADPFKPAE